MLTSSILYSKHVFLFHFKTNCRNGKNYPSFGTVALKEKKYFINKELQENFMVIQEDIYSQGT
jgi:hypothetical protein